MVPAAGNESPAGPVTNQTEQMKMQRFKAVAVAVIGGILATASVVCAQNTNSNVSTNSPRRGERRGQMVSQRVERMSTELKLSEEQKAKVTALFEKEAKQRREIVSEANLPREERRDKMRALMEDENKQLKVILTADQFEKWKQLREQMRARRPNSAGQTGGPAPAPEPKNPDKKAE
jgi:periplasmic protein CpxP/Spy